MSKTPFKSEEMYLLTIVYLDLIIFLFVIFISQIIVFFLDFLLNQTG